MSYSKRFICLANSRKIAGRCIAGKEPDGTWIRPISERPSAEVSEEERRYEDGSDPALYDEIEVMFKDTAPKSFQVENHVIDDRYYWEKVGVSNRSDALNLLDNPPTLWANNSSTYYGVHDRVSEAETAKLAGSLYLIKPTALALNVALEGMEFGNGKRRVKATFTYNNVTYKIAVTDPVIERKFLAGPNGDFQVNDPLISVSLGEIYQGYAYKLVAAIL